MPARVLLADLDSLAQARRWVELGPERARAELVGRMRTALLLDYELALTPPMLLDGVILLDLGPGGLAAELGVGRDALPLVVVSHRGTTAEALERAYADGDRFEWSSGKALEARPRPGLVPENARQEWLAEISAGRVAEQVGAPAPFALTHEPFGAPGEAGGVVDLVATLRELTARSTARDVLARAEADGVIDVAARADLEAWWERGYFAALAGQWGIPWMDFADRERPAALGRLGPGAFGIGGKIIEQLEQMPPAVFVLARFAVREAVADWRKKPDNDALLDVAYALQTFTSTAQRRTALRARRRSVVVLGALALLAAVVTVLDGAGLWVLWLGAAVVVLQSVPWSDLAELRALRRQSMRAVVHLAR